MSRFFDASLEIVVLSVKELIEAGYEIKRSVTIGKDIGKESLRMGPAQLLIPPKSDFVDYLNANYRSVLVEDEVDEVYQLIANRDVYRNQEEEYAPADYALDNVEIDCLYRAGEDSDIQKGHFDNDYIAITVSALLTKTKGIEEPLNSDNPITNHSFAWFVYEFLLCQTNIGFSVEFPQYPNKSDQYPFTALIQKRQSDMQAIEHVISTLPTEGE